MNFIAKNSWYLFHGAVVALMLFFGTKPMAELMMLTAFYISFQTCLHWKHLKKRQRLLVGRFGRSIGRLTTSHVYAL